MTYHVTNINNKAVIEVEFYDIWINAIHILFHSSNNYGYQWFTEICEQNYGLQSEFRVYKVN